MTNDLGPKDTFLSFSKENGIFRIQSAFEIMGLNEHTNFSGFTKNQYSR